MARNRDVSKQAADRVINNGLSPIEGLGYSNKAELKFDPEFPVSDIVERETTPRVYDPVSDEVLKESIVDFGFIEPVIIDEDNRIIHGQHRFTIARDMGFEGIPAIKVNTLKSKDHTNEFYPLIANKLNDWTKWVPSSVDSTLKKMDGGIKMVDIPGDNGTVATVPDESGKYRDLAKRLGLFIDVIPKNLTATTSTLMELAKLREKSLGNKYQYDDAQLLYIETLRQEILRCRNKLIDIGDTFGNVRQKAYQFDRSEEEDRRVGAVVARCAFLSSLGIMNKEIGERLGIAINSKNLNIHEHLSVNGCLAKAASREGQNPAGIYAYLLRGLFENFNKADKDDILKRLDKEYNDGKLSREDFIDKVKEIVGATQEQAEDWVDYHNKRKYLYQANEVFSYLIEEDKEAQEAAKRKIAERPGGKIPTDVKILKSSSGKGCSLIDWLEIARLDHYYGDDPVESDKKADAFYNTSSVSEFNKVLYAIRDKYRQGPNQDSLFPIEDQIEDESKIREENKKRKTSRKGKKESK